MENARRLFRILGFATALLSALLLAGCNEDTPETLAAQKAIAIESGEECHLCGMIITNYPGPKGQLYERGQTKNLRFCSTRDMFAYWLDPEHKHNIQNAYVQDMTVVPWESASIGRAIDARHYIEARTALYVVGHSRRGAQGPTLASFATKGAVDSFIASYGGQLRSFEQLDMDLISHMMSQLNTIPDSEVQESRRIG